VRGSFKYFCPSLTAGDLKWSLVIIISTNSEIIEFVLFGLDLLEPNVLITDALLGLLSVFFARKVAQLPSTHMFFRNWQLFLFLFGVGTILGGIGHAFYNYLDLGGKIPAWLFAIVSVYFIESSMFSIHPDKAFANRLSLLSSLKLVLMLLMLIVILVFATPANKISLSILLVILNSLMGVTFSAGFLGLHYYRIGLSSHFSFFFTGVLIMIPSSAVFLLEVNLFRWFDRNDLSHLILAVGISFFYLGILQLSREDEIDQQLKNSSC